MEDIVALAEQAGIYEKYRRELSEAESGERERETKRALSEKYSALAEDIRRFLSNGQFALVLNKLTLLFKGVLSYEGCLLYTSGAPYARIRRRRYVCTRGAVGDRRRNCGKHSQRQGRNAGV